jgi:ribosomal protein S27E
MTVGQDQVDCCPHCRGRVEIAALKFTFRGTAMVVRCSNCAMAFVEDCGGAKSTSGDLEVDRSLWQGMADRLDKLTLRARLVLTFRSRRHGHRSW